MDWNEFFASFSAAQGALAGVVIGAFLTGWYNLTAKRLEYRNAMYGKLVEKRLKAYEELEKAIEPLNDLIELQGMLKIVTIHSIMHDGRYKEVFRQIKGFTFKRRWLRPKTLKAYSSLNEAIDEIDHFLTYAPEEEVAEFAEMIAGPINLGFHHLMNCMQADYPHLHKLDESFPSYVVRVWKKLWRKLSGATPPKQNGLTPKKPRTMRAVGTEIPTVPGKGLPEHLPPPDPEQ